MLADLQTKMNKDFYLIGSSVHEMLVVPETDRLHPDGLKQMVYDINRPKPLVFSKPSRRNAASLNCSVWMIMSFAFLMNGLKSIRLRLDKKGYQRLKSLLNAFWDFAVNTGYTESNVARNIKPLGTAFFTPDGTLDVAEIREKFDDMDRTALLFSGKVINFFEGTLSRGVGCNQKVIKSNQNALNNKTPEPLVKSSNSGIPSSGEGGI